MRCCAPFADQPVRNREMRLGRHDMIRIGEKRTLARQAPPGSERLGEQARSRRRAGIGAVRPHQERCGLSVGVEQAVGVGVLSSRGGRGPRRARLLAHAGVYLVISECRRGQGVEISDAQRLTLRIKRAWRRCYHLATLIVVVGDRRYGSGGGGSSRDGASRRDEIFWWV